MFDLTLPWEHKAVCSLPTAIISHHRCWERIISLPLKRAGTYCLCWDVHQMYDELSYLQSQLRCTDSNIWDSFSLFQLKSQKKKKRQVWEWGLKTGALMLAPKRTDDFMQFLLNSNNCCPAYSTGSHRS